MVRRLSPQTYDKVISGQRLSPTYEVISEAFVEELTDDVQSSKEAGLIAQELYTVIPDAVTVGDEATPWTVDYNHVLAYALQAIKDLDQIVQQQAARITSLESKKSRTSK